MKFGIFYEHQLPRPWDEGSELQLIQDALEQVELADRLGFDVVWEVEHHFLEEYSHSARPRCSSPPRSQRTKNIRLGHGIIQTAPGYNHPARTAERVAMLDLVSGGRVEFGSGESSSEAELGGFGIDPVTKREAWLEGLEVAHPLHDRDAVHRRRRASSCTMPPRNVVPKPVQKPHPPLWVACSRRDTILLAAEKGIGALTFAFIDPEEARPLGGRLRGDPGREVRAGRRARQRQRRLRHPDDVRAHRGAGRRAAGLEGGNFFGYSLGHFYVFGDHQPGTTDVWAEFLERRGRAGLLPRRRRPRWQQERLGAKVAAGDTTGPARRHRHARPDPRVPPAATRRPASTSSSS